MFVMVILMTVFMVILAMFVPMFIVMAAIPVSAVIFSDDTTRADSQQQHSD
jgi:hypothetical protein